MGQESISVFLVFFAALLALVLVLSKYLHDQPLLSSILSEAGMVLLVGILAGFLIHCVIGDKLNGPENDNNRINNENNNNNNDYNDDDDSSSSEELHALLSFSPDIFFMALLPPIIFNSGLRVGALFARHFAPIVLFAIVGTTIAAISTALFLWLVLQLGWMGTGGEDVVSSSFTPTLTELLTFGALISSTDPVSTLAVFQAKRVDPQLFYLVFGESVLNDALAIVLFHCLSRFVAQQEQEENDSVSSVFVQFFIDLTLNAIGSLVLGVLLTLGTARLFKQLDLRQNRLIEICVYLLLMYIPFLLAEILQLSGIVTILFTGITSNRYVIPNLSPMTRLNADMVCRLLAHLAETSIFLELGLSVYGLVGHWNWAFIGWSIVACLVGRALNIYPLAFFFNKCLLRRTSAEVEEDTGGSDYWCNTDVRSDPGAAAASSLWRYPTINISPRAAQPERTRHIELTERFSPAREAAQDSHQLVQQALSFADMSVASEMTATPARRKDLKIRAKTSHMQFFSGLRGAVSYACVRTFPDTFGHQKDFTMTTMAIVLISVFVLGGTTELALNVLNINVNVDEETYMKERLREPVVATFVTHFGTSSSYLLTRT